MKLFLFLSLLLVLALACGESDTPASPDRASIQIPIDLLSERHLTGGCYDWPETEFSAENHAVLGSYGLVGEPAIEFTLKDLTGATHTLTSLLESRPVFMIFGSFT